MRPASLRHDIKDRVDYDLRFIELDVVSCLLGNNLSAVGGQFCQLGLRIEVRSRLYFDIILVSLSEAARRELQTMDPAKYEYQSDFAKRYIAQGRAEGRTALVVKLLAVRFGPLSTEVQTRIERASLDELDGIGERLLTAQTLQDALGPH